VIFGLAREINTLRSLHEISGERATPLSPRGSDDRSRPTREEVNRYRRTLVHLLDILGIELVSEKPHASQSIEPFVALLLETRTRLRDARQFALADGIRDRLKDLGVIVEDKAGGASAWRIER
jgi:cysteinyl-tRNA synthetase